MLKTPEHRSANIHRIQLIHERDELQKKLSDIHAQFQHERKKYRSIIICLTLLIFIVWVYL